MGALRGISTRPPVWCSLVAPLVLACASAPPPRPAIEAEPPERPFLWQASHPSLPGTLYLQGSVHAQQRSQAALHPAAEAALTEADVVVVEVDITEVNALALQWQVLVKGFIWTEQLSDHVSPETYERLRQYCQERGLPLERFDHMRPWLVGLTLAVGEMQRQGYDEEAGVDRMVLERAHAAGTPVRELETAAQQIDMLAGLPPELQDRLLLDAIYQEEGDDGTAALFEAYRAGDDTRVAALVFSERTEHPELEPLYRVMFDQRNRRMADKLLEMAREPRVFFVTVGAGHLVGEIGLPRMLRQEGFTVTRVGMPAPPGSQPATLEAGLSTRRAASSTPRDRLVHLVR